MAIRHYTTKTITMTAATDSTTISNLLGKVKCVSIKPSGTSTDFRISCNKAGVTEYILGSTAAVSVVAAGTIFYPKVIATNIDASALTTTGDLYQEIILKNQDVTVAVANGANAETYIVDIITEE